MNPTCHKSPTAQAPENHTHEKLSLSTPVIITTLHLRPTARNGTDKKKLQAPKTTAQPTRVGVTSGLSQNDRRLSWLARRTLRTPALYRFFCTVSLRWGAPVGNELYIKNFLFFSFTRLFFSFSLCLLFLLPVVV
ncbi:hypothetical protein CEXT_97811 [Caerostris extrusa]|uniref:Uncharacterized protein n=1 Tax=Caerostris extrusa TaxID=172846 RepID=A0AAV4U592_CAEEX|nr:hypothetical protein CEXT_97811 [Caerostris extrusa]